MSSHHFVKEGQEPALFVVEKSLFQFAEPLLEWVPLVMVLDHVLEDVLQWGIKIDIVLQHKIPISKVEELVINQQPVQILPAELGHVISKGLQFFVDNGYEAVNIIGSPRDEVFKEVERLTNKLQVGIYDEQVKWSFITSGLFEKWMPAGYNFFIRSDVTAPLLTEGIAQKGPGWQTLSEKIVTIKSETPFWVGEQY